MPQHDAVILLTHAGPDGSGTSLVTAQDADSGGAAIGLRIPADQMFNRSTRARSRWASF